MGCFWLIYFGYLIIIIKCNKFVFVCLLSTYQLRAKYRVSAAFSLFSCRPWRKESFRLETFSMGDSNSRTSITRSFLKRRLAHRTQRAERGAGHIERGVPDGARLSQACSPQKSTVFDVPGQSGVAWRHWAYYWSRGPGSRSQSQSRHGRRQTRLFPRLLVEVEKAAGKQRLMRAISLNRRWSEEPKHN